MQNPNVYFLKINIFFSYENLSEHVAIHFALASSDVRDFLLCFVWFLLLLRGGGGGRGDSGSRWGQRIADLGTAGLGNN